MKNTNCCPKCNGTDIIRIEGKAGAYGVGNNIQGSRNVKSCCDTMVY